MPKLLQIVHGYPPRELAGTEIYAERLTRALSERGWQVEILAATRAPGRPQASWLPEEKDGAGNAIHRIVNNLPWRPLWACEKDNSIAAACNERITAINPDIVHVQHLLFLDLTLRLDAPSIVTLHDAWSWCPRGGSLLEHGKTPCSGPSPEKCPNCYGHFAKGSAMEHRLGHLASKINPIVSTERLHKAWRRAPPALRRWIQKGPAPTQREGDLEARQLAVKQAFNDFDTRLSPSRFLSEEAEKQGVKPVEVFPHGVELSQPPQDPQHFLFVGSIAWHKGPDLVAKAWQLAKKEDPGLPKLRIAGPVVESDCAAAIPDSMKIGRITPSEVRAELSKAHALVVGSIWPENSPLVILEARAAGCPVIVPDIGGIPEIVREGRDGWLYPPGNVESLKERFLKWKELTSLQVAPPLRFETHVTRLEARYHQLLNQER